MIIECIEGFNNKTIVFDLPLNSIFGIYLIDDNNNLKEKS
jgi:hypothetical protein